MTTTVYNNPEREGRLIPGLTAGPAARLLPFPPAWPAGPFSRVGAMSDADYVARVQTQLSELLIQAIAAFYAAVRSDRPAEEFWGDVEQRRRELVGLISQRLDDLAVRVLRAEPGDWRQGVRRCGAGVRPDPPPLALDIAAPPP